MKIKEALLDTAFSLETISKRPALHNMGPGRALLAEAKRLRLISEQVDPEEEFVND